jgi:hypothetical protein
LLRIFSIKITLDSKEFEIIPKSPDATLTIHHKLFTATLKGPIKEAIKLVKDVAKQLRTNQYAKGRRFLTIEDAIDYLKETESYVESDSREV